MKYLLVLLGRKHILRHGPAGGDQEKEVPEDGLCASNHLGQSGELREAVAGNRGVDLKGETGFYGVGGASQRSLKRAPDPAEGVMGLGFGPVQAEGDAGKPGLFEPF